MLRAWCQIRRAFKMRHGRGRLKTRLLMNEIPPDMLIHLRAIHALKQQNHLFYEIQRAKTINEIRPGGAPPAVPAGGETSPPVPTDEKKTETPATQEERKMSASGEESIQEQAKLRLRLDEVDADQSGTKQPA